MYTRLPVTDDRRRMKKQIFSAMSAVSRITARASFLLMTAGGSATLSVLVLQSASENVIEARFPAIVATLLHCTHRTGSCRSSAGPSLMCFSGGYLGMCLLFTALMRPYFTLFHAVVQVSASRDRFAGR